MISRQWLFCLRRFESKLDVQPDALDPHRSAIVIKRRIRVVLQIEGREKARKKPRAIVALPYVLGRIIQPPFADQKIEPAASQIHRVKPGNAARGERTCRDVIRPFPQRPLERYSAGRQPIDRREGPTLRLTVIPSEPAEHT